mgnify:FL=1
MLLGKRWQRDVHLINICNRQAWLRCCSGILIEVQRGEKQAGPGNANLRICFDTHSVFCSIEFSGRSVDISAQSTLSTDYRIITGAIWAGYIPPNAISSIAWIAVGKWILVDFCGLNVLTGLKSKNCANFAPVPVFRYLKGQFIIDTPLHTVQLLIMRTLQSRQSVRNITTKIKYPVLLTNRGNWYEEIHQFSCTKAFS